MSIAKQGKYDGVNNLMFGKNHSATTREKIRNSLKGENHPKTTGVILTDLHGLTITEFPTREEAGRWLGVTSQAIRNAIRRGSIIQEKSAPGQSSE
jgi:NUMOD3 motif